MRDQVSEDAYSDHYNSSRLCYSLGNSHEIPGQILAAALNSLPQTHGVRPFVVRPTVRVRLSPRPPNDATRIRFPKAAISACHSQSVSYLVSKPPSCSSLPSPLSLRSSYLSRECFWTAWGLQGCRGPRPLRRRRRHRWKVLTFIGHRHPLSGRQAQSGGRYRSGGTDSTVFSVPGDDSELNSGNGNIMFAVMELSSLFH